MRKIHTLNWAKDRLSIRRSKLAHEVAKKLERYLNHMAVRLYRNGINFMVAHKRVVEGRSRRIRRR